LLSRRIILSDAILVEKAKLLANGLGVPENALQFSSGWLQGFKKRNGIRQEKLQHLLMKLLLLKLYHYYTINVLIILLNESRNRAILPVHLIF